MGLLDAFNGFSGGTGGFFDGYSAPDPSQGLLGDMYDTKSLSKAKRKRALLQAGLAMMAQGPSQYPINMITSLGQGLQQGVQGANEYEDQYRKQAMDAHALKQEADKTAYQRNRDGINDAWNAKLQGRQQSQWGAQDAMIGAVPEADRPMAKAYPDAYAQQLFEQKFAKPTPPTDDMREYSVAKSQGYEGSFYDYMKDMKSAAASKTNIDLGGNSYKKKRGEKFAETASDLDKEALAATRSLGALGAMKQAMTDPSFYSGTGANQVLAIKRLGVSLGMDPNSVSSMETFSANAKQMALDSMGGSLGSGFSNADRDFVTGQVPGIENTPSGNAALVNYTEKIQTRKIQIAQMAREYELDNGEIDAGFFQQLSQWAEQNPLFPITPPQQGGPQQGGGQPDFSGMSDAELEALANGP